MSERIKVLGMVIKVDGVINTFITGFKTFSVRLCPNLSSAQGDWCGCLYSRFSDAPGQLCLFCRASMLYDELRSYSIHPPVQGTKGIHCSPLLVRTLRFLLPKRVKEGKDMCLGVLTCSMAWTWTGNLGSNIMTPNSRMKTWGKALAQIFSGC